MTVPNGTKAANAYLALNGSSGNYASTPDSVANSVTGDIDLRAHVALADWTPSAPNVIIAKAGSWYSYQFYVNNSGSLVLMTSANGTSWISATSTATPSISDGQDLWIKATRDVDNGSSGNTTQFFTSTDGSSWTQLGSNVVNSGTTSIYNSTDSVEVGSDFGGCCNNLTGKVYYADIRNGIGSAASVTFDPLLASSSSTTWTAATGEVWTINRSGSTSPADVAASLTVSTSAGAPTGGTAIVRLVDALITYQFTSTSVTAGTLVTIGFSGFSDTPNSGTYTSTISTYSGASLVDSTSIQRRINSTLSLSGLTVNVNILPELTFTIAGHNSGSCNGASISATSSSATQVAFGSVLPGSNTVAAQTSR